MTKPEIIEIALSMVEGRPIKPSLEKLLDNEINRLIHKKRFWWRKKHATFTATVGTQTYDMASTELSNPAPAPDLEKIISLHRVNTDKSTNLIHYQGDPDLQQAMFQSGLTNGTPSSYVISAKDGLKVIRFDVPEDTANVYQPIYWATYVPSEDEEIPLIPEQFHYVLQSGLMRRVFLYLFGQKDPRYVAESQEYLDGLEDLYRFDSPSEDFQTELRSHDPRYQVQSTN